MSSQPDAGRLAKLRPENLAEDQLGLYDAIARGPRATGPQLFRLTDDEGGLEGPFNAMLLSPPVGSALQALGSAVRYRSALPDRAREIAILVVAHHWQSDFEVYAHEAVGRAAGLSDDEVGAIRAARPDDLPVPYERVVARTARALCATRDLSRDEYAAALDALGERVLFELTTIVGYYATLALQLRVYRVVSPVLA